MGPKLHEIEWHETYKLGFPEIDNDHRHLFNIANDIIKSFNNRSYEECKWLSIRFVETLEQHFSREEKFLKEIGYTKLKLHATYHRRLPARAKEFVRQCKNEKDEEILKAFFVRLLPSLLADVRGGDLDFRTHLLEKGLDKALIKERFGSIWI